MARATLEMFLKLTGANKTSQGLDKVSKSTKELDKDVKNSAKQNEQFAAGMSGLGPIPPYIILGLAFAAGLDAPHLAFVIFIEYFLIHVNISILYIGGCFVCIEVFVVAFED